MSESLTLFGKVCGSLPCGAREIGVASGKVRATLAFRRISLWHIGHVCFKQCKVFNVIIAFENNMSRSAIAILNVGLITNIILIHNSRGHAGCVRTLMSLYP